RTKVMLDFLTIMWFSGVRGCLHKSTVSDLFSCLATQLPLEHPTSIQTKILHDAFLTTLATAEALRSVASLSDINKVWQDDILWQVASLSMKCSNLFAAGECAS